MDNFTKVPNWFWTEWMKERLNGSESSVYICIIRHTYGFHSRNAKLSTYTIARETGLPIRTVERAIHSLKGKNLIKTKTRLKKNKMYETNEITLVKYGKTTVKNDGDTTVKIDVKPPSKMTDIKEINKDPSSALGPLDPSLDGKKKRDWSAELGEGYEL